MKFRSLVVAGASLVALAAPAVSQAADDPVSVTLSGGALVYTTPFSAANFDAVTLGAVPQTTNADVADWKVTDNRGTLAGWKVQIQATQFTDNNGTAADATDDKTLPAGSMSVAPLGAVNPTTAVTNLSTAPSVSTPALAIDGAAAPQTIALAATGVSGIIGGGEWTFSHGADNNDLILTVAPGAQAGTYTSTITTTLSNSAL